MHTVSQTVLTIFLIVVLSVQEANHVFLLFACLVLAVVDACFGLILNGREVHLRTYIVGHIDVRQSCGHPTGHLFAGIGKGIVITANGEGAARIIVIG